VSWTVRVRERAVMGEPTPGSGRFYAAVDTQGYCSLKPIGRGHGGARLIKAMVARAKELGADIRFLTTVRKILTANGHITGVDVEDKFGNTVHIDAKAVEVAEQAEIIPESEKSRRKSGNSQENQ